MECWIFQGGTFADINNWEIVISGREFDREIEELSGEVKNLVGNKLNIDSKYDFSYTNASSSMQQEDGYSYIEKETAIASMTLNASMNTGMFPMSSDGAYYVFAKIRVVVEDLNEEYKGVITNSLQVGNGVVETNNQDISVNEFQTIYLGKVSWTTRPSYFYLSTLQIKYKSGGAIAGMKKAKLEYYGGYIVKGNLIEYYDKNEIANKLDYSLQSCTVQIVGSVTKIDGKIEQIEEKLENNSNEIDSTKNSLQDIEASFTEVSSEVDLRIENLTSSNVQNMGEYLRTTKEYPYIVSFTQKNYFSCPTGLYSCYAKLEISDTDNTEGLYANVYIKRNGVNSTNVGKYNIPLNKIVSVYLGDLQDPGTSSYFYVSLEYIHNADGQNQTTLGAITYDLYGVYYVKEESISAIKESIANMLNFESTSSKFMLSVFESEESKHAASADTSENSEKAKLSDVTDTIYRNKVAKCYGDSLVTYISWANFQKLLGVSGVNTGQGGGKVCNNDPTVRHGFCSLERIAMLPKAMKLLVIYGGANDNVRSDNTPYVVDESKLGSIADEPLSIENMCNYRVTIANVSNTNTLGRAQTFYQGYKTMLRNIMALYPDCQILCVTQHRYYNYILSNGGFSDTPQLNLGAYEKVKAIKEVAEEYSVPVCDLWATSGVNDHNRRYTLVDLAGVLVHPTPATANKEESLILNKVLEIAPKFELGSYTTTNGEDIIEMKKWVVDVRDNEECNVMTLQEAINEFVSKIDSESIDLRNNMLLTFYSNVNYVSKVYVLTDYTQPSLTSSWEEWAIQDIDDPNES